MSSEFRMGDWFLTSSGRRFWPLDCREEDLYIEDIAHALAHVCRFGGHSLQFYSVAQHAIHVSLLVPSEYQRTALMHDAPEFALGDMIRPLKMFMPEYQSAERHLWGVIARRFNLPEYIPAVIKTADNIALMTERRDLMAENNFRWGIDEQPDPKRIVPMSPDEAKSAFLARFQELFS